MRAVTFLSPGEVRLDERPDPELESSADAIVRIEASGICGSDLHIYHGRVPIEPGFTLGHEFVGTVLASGDAVTRVALGDRVLGCFDTACATCLSAPAPATTTRASAAGPSATARISATCRGAGRERWAPAVNTTLRRVPESGRRRRRPVRQAT